MIEGACVGRELSLSVDEKEFGAKSTYIQRCKSFPRRSTTNSLNFMKFKILSLDECFQMIARGESIGNSVKIIATRICSSLTQETLDSVCLLFPYTEILEILRSTADKANAMFALQALSRASDSNHFPVSFFSELAVVNFLISLLGVEAQYAPYVFHIFTKIVCDSVEMRDYLMEKDVMRYISNAKSSSSEFEFLATVASIEPYLNDKLNFHISRLMMAQLQTQETNTISLFLHFIHSQAFDNFRAYSSDFIASLHHDLGITAQLSKLVLNVLPLISDVEPNYYICMLTHEALFFPHDEPFLCWVFNMISNFQDSMMADVFQECCSKLMKLAKVTSYETDKIIARMIATCHHDITKKSMVYKLAKFIIDDEIGALCIAKLSPILCNIEMSKNKEFLIQICIIIEGALEEISHSSREDAEGAGFLLNCIAKYIYI